MNHMIDRRSFAAMGLAGSAALIAGSGAQAAQPQAADGPALRTGKKTQVTMLLYPGTTVLDWVGPYEALHRVEGIEVVLAAKTTDLMKSDSGIMDYKANVRFDQIDRTDVLLVPGGAKGLMEASNDPVTMDWLRRMDSSSIYTVGICTGSLMLSHAGLLKGKRATTYWKFTGMLDQAGSTFVPERWVRDGKYWTSAGVSAGIDLTLALIADLYGAKRAMMAQLAIEYDPHPPFNAGSVRTAPQEVIKALGG
ncbi:DJ-1/PfpI family protein [Niveispirillum sp.]|uniref:DJ-1/PfpI family protein n=1 Tax=Niveispirillum sp. TaxID=1917217 RepID=UPI001B6D80A6|nr:DJ-1/PfpI family protein [Niveispirillum sp.]MBP7334336.1 DJ-1/PfpI family protein [Niveispirillum sp.]